MVKSITIANFKRFEKPIKIDFWIHKSKDEGDDFIIGGNISSVTGIIGKNATGKTSILEAIAFYADFNLEFFLKPFSKKAYFEKINELIKKANKPTVPEERKLEIRKQYQEMMKNVDKPTGEIPILKKEIDRLFLNKYKSKVNTMGRPISFVFEYFDNGQMITHKLNISATEIEEKIIDNNKKEIHSSKNSIYGFKSQLLTIMQVKKLNTIALTINEKIANENISEIIKIYMQKNPKFFKTFIKIVDETIDDFIFNSGGFPVAYISKSNAKPLDFKSLSQGTKTMISLYDNIYYALFEQKTFLLIDEIENSLHFKIIKFIITIFKKRYNKLNSQLLFSTHNPFIFDDDFKSNSIYFIDDYKLLQNEEQFDKKIAPSYLRGELVSNPNHKYRFDFLDTIIDSYEKND